MLAGVAKPVVAPALGGRSNGGGLEILSWPSRMVPAHPETLIL